MSLERRLERAVDKAFRSVDDLTGNEGEEEALVAPELNFEKSA